MYGDIFAIDLNSIDIRYTVIRSVYISKTIELSIVVQIVRLIGLHADGDLALLQAARRDRAADIRRVLVDQHVHERDEAADAVFRIGHRCGGIRAGRRERMVVLLVVADEAISWMDETENDTINSIILLLFFTTSYIALERRNRMWCGCDGGVIRVMASSLLLAVAEVPRNVAL